MGKKRQRRRITDEKFTLRDLKGVIILAAGLLTIQLLVYFIKVFPDEENKSFAVSVAKAETGRPDVKKQPVRTDDKALRPFDPNTVDSASLVSFGFSPKQAASILKYRASGGKFYVPEDFSKLYVVNEYMFNRLQPYIRISGGGTAQQRKKVERMNLNTADSVQLDMLPGIGGYYANKIIEYRHRLGWFVDKAQLLEIHRFGDERFEKLKDRIYVSETERVFLCDCDSAFIVAHPYLGPAAYRAIVEFNDFHTGRKPLMKEYLENKVIRSLNGEYLLKQFR